MVEAPNYVEQIRGAALGSKIVPFDPGGALKDNELMAGWVRKPDSFPEYATQGKVRS